MLLLGASDDGPFTMRLAQSLSPEALERRVLQAPQVTTRNVAVIDTQFRTPNYGWSAFEIAFAAAPAPEKFGLCVAEVQVATFGPRGADFTRDTPVRLRRLIGSRRFAISETDLAGGTKASQATCESLGPVLDIQNGPSSRYFAAYSGRGQELGVSEAKRAIRVIQHMIAEGGASPITCKEDVFAQYYKGVSPLCRDRKALLRSLDWKTLSYLSSSYCGGERTCISAVFNRPAAVSEMMMVHLDLTVDGASLVNGEVRSLGKIESASITGVSHVD